MGKMSKRERIAAALKGDPVDRVPISAWGHYPSDPRRAEYLVREAVKFQNEFDWDFAKLMPTGMYPAEALGAKTRYEAVPFGTTRLAEPLVRQAGDWASLPLIGPANNDVLADIVEGARLSRQRLPGDIPVLQSVFSPLTIANKCVGDSLPLYLRLHPKELHAGLEIITEGTVRLVKALMQTGIDGIFFATQDASRDVLSDSEFLEFGKPYDLRVLREVQGAFFNMLHVCRTNIMSELVADYPLHAINWEAAHQYPSLMEAAEVWRQCRVGGIDRKGVLAKGTVEQIKSEVKNAVAQTEGRHIIVTPDCSLPLPRPERNLHAARQAVEEVRLP